MSLKTMALSFVGLFVPIYLYNLGYTPFTIFGYYTLLFLVKGISEGFFARLIIKIGPKHGFIYSFPLLFAYLFMVLTLPDYHWNIFLLAFISGTGLSLSWLSYHIDFSKARKKDQSSKALSQIQALLTITGAIAPFVGGLIATRYGMDKALILSMITLLIAGLPLLKTREPHIEKKLDMKKLDYKKIRGDIIGAIGIGFNNSVLYEIWPFFIFLIVGTYEEVGSLESIALLLTVFTTLYLGRKITKDNRHKILNKGAEINGVLFFVRAAAQTIFHVLFLNIAQSVFAPFLRIPFFSELYMHTDEEPRIEYLSTTERALDFGRTFLFAMLALISLIVSLKTVLIIGILMGGIGSLLTGYIRPAKDEI
ncbi:MFS transporter [bacterium]|nr:MFS transporter [bacterium]